MPDTKNETITKWNMIRETGKTIRPEQIMCQRENDSPFKKLGGPIPRIKSRRRKYSRKKLSGVSQNLEEEISSPISMPQQFDINIKGGSKRESVLFKENIVLESQVASVTSRTKPSNTAARIRRIMKRQTKERSLNNARPAEDMFEENLKDSTPKNLTTIEEESLKSSKQPFNKLSEVDSRGSEWFTSGYNEGRNGSLSSSHIEDFPSRDNARVMRSSNVSSVTDPKVFQNGMTEPLVYLQLDKGIDKHFLNESRKHDQPPIDVSLNNDQYWKKALRDLNQDTGNDLGNTVFKSDNYGFVNEQS